MNELMKRRLIQPAAIFLAASLLFPTLETMASAQGNGTLSLADATSVALTVSPSVSIAQQNLAQARARLGQAQAQRRFQITFNSTGSLTNATPYQNPPSEETFGTLQNSVTIPLPIGRKLSVLELQANRTMAASEAQVQSARLDAAGRVQTAYFDLLKQRALLATAQENRKQATAQLAAARRRYEIGVAPQLDVLKAQGPLATAEASIAQSLTQVANSQQVLNQILGNSLDSPTDIADVTTVPPLTMTLDEVRRQAVENSADVRAAEATVQAAEAALMAARLTRTPDLSLQASDTRSKDVTGFARQDTVQLSVTIPLTDGGLARAQIQEAEATLRSAQLSVGLARQTAELTGGTAFLTAQGTISQIAPTQTAVEIAQTTLDKTREGYLAGLSPIIDVLNAQLALNQARIAHTQAIYDAAAAVATLNRALGKEMP